MKTMLKTMLSVLLIGMIAAGDAREILRCAVGLSSMLDAVTE